MFSLTRDLAQVIEATAVSGFYAGRRSVCSGALLQRRAHASLAEPRLVGVLQRLVIAYAMTGLLFCFLKPRMFAAIAAALLVGYRERDDVRPDYDIELTDRRCSPGGRNSRPIKGSTPDASRAEAIRFDRTSGDIAPSIPAERRRRTRFQGRFRSVV